MMFLINVLKINYHFSHDTVGLHDGSVYFIIKTFLSQFKHGKHVIQFNIKTKKIWKFRNEFVNAKKKSLGDLFVMFHKRKFIFLDFYSIFQP